MRWLVIAALLLPSIAWAETPAPPSCEDQMVVAAQYVNQVRVIRDQYEYEVAQGRAQIQALQKRVKELESAAQTTPRTLK